MPGAAAPSTPGPSTPVYPGPVYPGPVYPGPVYPGPVYPGPVYPGPVYPGPVYPGPVYPGPVYPGPVYPGPVYPGPVYPGSVYPGSVYPGPVYPGPVYPGPVYPGPVYPGPVYPGPVYPGPVYPGPVYPGPVYPGSVYPGSVYPGSVYPGSVYPGSVCPGSVCPRSVCSGSIHARPIRPRSPPRPVASARSAGITPPARENPRQMLPITFAAPALPPAGALVLPVVAGEEPSALHRRLDQEGNGMLSRALAAEGFEGQPTRVVTVLAPGAGLGRVVAVGLGARDGLDADTVERAAAAAIPALARDEAAAFDASGLDAALAAAAATGFASRAWRFDLYRTNVADEDRPKLARLAILTDHAEAAASLWDRHLRPVLEGVFVARSLVTEPANVLTPAEFARRCEALAPLGLAIEVLGRKEMEKLGFGALLGVAAGSANKPRLVVMQWNGVAKEAAGTDAAPWCLVGKGVTFDSGGLSIKPAAGMEDMKWDMAGAAAVTGAMAALAGRRAPVHVVGLIGLVENMLGDAAQRPGDVVRSASGRTIEVLNTDAEGRLVLADVLHYAIDRFAPRAVVDLATLTGAIVVGLGHEYAGLFSSDDALADTLLAAGRETGEKLWRMPLDPAYDKALDSPIADVKNIGGGRAGGAITAAHFLKRFVPAGIPWAHLDIAGVAWGAKDNGIVPRGATAFGVRLLDRWLAHAADFGPREAGRN